MVGAAAFMSLTKKQQLQIFTVSLQHLNQALDMMTPVIDMGIIVPPRIP